jgi:hypothetical protein
MPVLDLFESLAEIRPTVYLGLVAPPCLPDRVSPRLPGAATGAVELTAVAATANNHLSAATGA